MTKMIDKIKCWIFKMWVKKQAKKANKLDQVNEDTKLSTFIEPHEQLTESDKKNIIKDFNQERENREYIAKSTVEAHKSNHLEVLAETYRSEKPIYSNTLTEKFAHGNSIYRLTKKQLFFIEAILNQNTSGTLDLHLVCNQFLMQKYQNPEDFTALSKEKFKPKYHKKTIRSLAALNMIEQRGRNWYLCI